MLLRILLGVVGATCLAVATPLTETVDRLNLTELAPTIQGEKLERILAGKGAELTVEDRQAAAVLIAVGVVAAADLDDQAGLELTLARVWDVEVRESGERVRLPIERPTELLHLLEMGGHDALRTEAGLVDALNRALGEGVITGYGLRRSRVSAGTVPERTLIYSHNRWRHVQQLVALMASEGIEGEVDITPKVSAFLFRDGWGERPEWVAELGPGIYAAQSTEWLVHFEFKEADGPKHFHDAVTQFAKKDAPDETGNIYHAWWQPFYYSEVPVGDFFQIGRVTLMTAQAEVSLLALDENIAKVREHFAAMPWEVTVDQIWVPGPFYRFLLGDYK